MRYYKVCDRYRNTSEEIRLHNSDSLWITVSVGNINQHQSLCAHKGQSSPAAAAKCGTRMRLVGGGWKLPACTFWPTERVRLKSTEAKTQNSDFTPLGGGGTLKHTIKPSENGTADCAGAVRARFPEDFKEPKLKNSRREGVICGQLDRNMGSLTK